MVEVVSYELQKPGHHLQEMMKECSHLSKTASYANPMFYLYISQFS
jgi:hypothetical protein